MPYINLKYILASKNSVQMITKKTAEIATTWRKYDGVRESIRPKFSYRGVLIHMKETETGIAIEVNFLHLPNASSRIVVTESGIVMNANFLQQNKACCPMEVTDSGIAIELNTPTEGFIPNIRD